jgi:hypothetical protein
MMAWKVVTTVEDNLVEFPTFDDSQKAGPHAASPFQLNLTVGVGLWYRS